MASIETYGLNDEDLTAEVREIRTEHNEAIYGQLDYPNETELAKIDSVPDEMLGDEEIDELFQDEIARANPDAADSLQLYLEQIAKIPLLRGLSEERALAQRIERGDKVAKDKMVESNLRLVVSIAKVYRRSGVEFLDIIQEGTIGLMRAAEKYDWRREFKFSTYATWWIRQACQRGTANQGRTIRLPVHVIERVIKINKFESKFLVQHGRDPTPEEITEATELPLYHVIETLNAGMVSISLNKTVDDKGENELGGLLHDESQIPTDEAALDEIFNQELRKLLDTLPERERRILELRYGFEGKPWTLAAIGRELGLTRERVRQLERRAVRRLQVLQQVSQKDNGNENKTFQLKKDQTFSFDDKETRILYLYRRHGSLPLPEVAERTGMTVPTVKNRLRKMTRMLEAEDRQDFVRKARGMEEIEVQTSEDA